MERLPLCISPEHQTPSSPSLERVFKDLPRTPVGFDGFDLPVSFRMDLHLKLLAPGSWSRDLDLESIPFMEAHRPFERGLWALSQPSMLEPGAFFALFSLLSHEASLGVSHVRV